MGVDLVAMITAAGYAGVTIVVFAETGLLIGFFLPGDSLLFTAGFLASVGTFRIVPLMAFCTVAAIVGDSVGYALGRRVGPKIFRREDSLLFHRDHIERTERFFQTYGSKAIILARFMPIVRTFTPVLAGVGSMRYRTFLVYNVIGGVLWASGVPLLGYFLGRSIPGIDHYLIPIVLLIIFVSVAPGAWHIIRSPRELARIISFIRSFWSRLIRRA